MAWIDTLKEAEGKSSSNSQMLKETELNMIDVFDTDYFKSSSSQSTVNVKEFS